MVSLIKIIYAAKIVIAIEFRNNLDYILKLYQLIIHYWLLDLGLI